MNATVDSRDESAGEWLRETVSIDAAYGGERVIIHLDLPTNAVPPFQPCIYFPGMNAREQSYFKEAYWENFDFMPRSGRVFVRPVFAHTYERGGGHGRAGDKNLYKKWRQDLGRTIDYLAERPDMDVEKVAYAGLSLGAVMVPYLCAMEDRIQSIIMIAGGATDKMLFSYVGRVTTPLLMLNGRYDYINPPELSQIPFFERLGTPDKDKRHVVFETGHLPLPRGGMIKEILAWLERYQNPVILTGHSERHVQDR